MTKDSWTSSKLLWYIRLRKNKQQLIFFPPDVSINPMCHRWNLVFPIFGKLVGITGAPAWVIVGLTSVEALPWDKGPDKDMTTGDLSLHGRGTQAFLSNVNPLESDLPISFDFQCHQPWKLCLILLFLYLKSQLFQMDHQKCIICGWTATIRFHVYFSLKSIVGLCHCGSLLAQVGYPDQPADPDGSTFLWQNAWLKQ